MKRKRTPASHNWKKGPILATGSSAVVYSGVINIQDHPTMVAIKTAPTSNSSSLTKEKAILHNLRGCPQILRCFFADSSYDDENEVEEYHLFLELAPYGTLSDFIKFDGRLDEPYIRAYTRSILLGLSHIHRKGYVHCDVKPKNILVWSPEEVKIADFGLAKRSGEETTGIRGTLLYIAPESIRREEYEAAVDIWALGCTVIEMATGEPAWNLPEGVDEVAEMLRIGRSEELPEMPEEVSELGKDFLRKCLVKDPEERWTAEMLLEHPFVSDCGDDSEEEEEEEVSVAHNLKEVKPAVVSMAMI